MAPGGSYGRATAPKAGQAVKVCIDEGRLDPGLERLSACAAPAVVPLYLFIGLPICFMIALGIILLGFYGALNPAALGFLALGVLGLFSVRYLNRHS